MDIRDVKNFIENYPEETLLIIEVGIGNSDIVLCANDSLSYLTVYKNTTSTTLVSLLEMTVKTYKNNNTILETIYG